MTDHQEIRCSNCGAVLDAGALECAVASPDPCPNCGSTQQTLHLVFTDRVLINVRDRVEMKVRDNTFPTKKNIRRELIQGFDARISKGDYVCKEREIDRDNNTYREHITEQTGEVIRSVSESLTDHFGHGSAKSKKPPKSGEGE